MGWDWKSLQALILRAPLCGAKNWKNGKANDYSSFIFQLKTSFGGGKILPWTWVGEMQAREACT